MNILLLTMSAMPSLTDRGIYTDLMRKFRDEGHGVYIVTPVERRQGIRMNLSDADGVHILGVRTLNVQKTNVLEKGVGQVSIGMLYKRAIKRYFKGVRFDLILYSTPPITLLGVVKYVRRQNPRAMTYLLLKDIFPQNAVDMGMMSKTGVKGLLYRYFRRQEESLYKISDYIGCMSPANVKFLLENNPYINPARVEVNPNSIELADEPVKAKDSNRILKKYGIPTDSPVFIFGGNLGVPQGIPFLIECLDAVKHRQDCHFVVVGTGTYLSRLEDWYAGTRALAVTVLKGLPKKDYDLLVQACQVGLVFLDYRFTIPNYPSRLLSYLENSMAVIACTDPNCDMGSIAEANGYGFYCPSNDVNAFVKAVDRMLDSDFKAMGAKGYGFLKANYLVEHTYNLIMSHFTGKGI